MFNRVVVGFLLLAFCCANQADGQLFRRWGPPVQPQPNYQNQSMLNQYAQPQQYARQPQYATQPRYAQPTPQFQNPNCQQNQLLLQQQRRYQQAQLQPQAQGQLPVLNQQQAMTRQQLLEAQNQLARQQQLVSRLRASLQQQDFGLDNRGLQILPRIQSQLPNAQSSEVQQTQLQPLTIPAVKGVVELGTNQQFDIARQPALPLLVGPSTSNVEATAASVETTQLIEPAIVTPTGTVRDLAVTKASATSEAENGEGFSVLTPPQETSEEKSIIETAVEEIGEIEPEEIGGIELNGPESGKQ